MSILNNKNRCSYLEILKPDVGFRVEYIIGTTYSLELDTLLMSSLSLCLNANDDVGSLNADPVALLEACRKLQEVSIILYEPGEIHRPSKYNPLYYFLEQSLFPVNAPEGGVFHPKVWFIKYLNEEGESSYRFICLSRNITFDTSWDFALVLEGFEEETQNDNGRQLERFFRELKPSGFKPEQDAIYKRALDEMKRVKFIAPNNLGFSFHPLGIKNTDTPFDASRFERQCIVSPFLSESFDEYEYATKENILISCNHELKHMNDESRRRFDDILVVDDKLFDFQDDDARKETYKDVGDDLHAKMYFLEKGKNAELYVGSANATNAAFQDNVEFLVGLYGNKEKIGIDKFLGDEQFGFRTVLTKYFHEEPSLDEVTKKKNDLKLLAIKKALFESDLKYSYEETNGKFDLKLRFSPKEKWKKLNKAEFKVMIGLASKPSGLQELKEEIDFASIDISELTSLFIIQISLTNHKDTKTLIQKIEGTPFPKLRSDLIIRHSINSIENFLKFLFLILHGQGIDSEFFKDSKKNAGRKGSGDGVNYLFQIPLFEEILKTFARSPEKLESIQKVIDGLNDTEGKIVPKEFSEMWSQIQEAKGLLHAKS